MTTFSIVFTLIGFEFFYQTSKKALHHRAEKSATWFEQHEKPAKIYGVILLGIALSLSIYQFGVGSGIFAFLGILMLIGSLVVLVSPLRIVKPSWVVVGIAILFLIEIL